jgi:hypothetical protein
MKAKKITGTHRNKISAEALLMQIALSQAGNKKRKTHQSGREKNPTD